MGGGGRSGILVAWTGSVSSRSSSGMARVGGEHLGAGLGILFCLIGHATTAAAAAGAFPGSSVSPSISQSASRQQTGGVETRLSVPRLAARLPVVAARFSRE